MSELTPSVAKYCYACGRRVSPQQDHCWYCAAPTRRWIRTPKRCSFCGEEIRSEAIKCRHCGEFLDGRAKPESTNTRIIYVVDKELLRAAQDFRLEAGRPVPPEIARALEPETVQAIERNQPALIHEAGVRALPAPAAGGAAEETSEALPVRQERPRGKPRDVRDLVPAGRDVQVRTAGGEMGHPPVPALAEKGLSLGGLLGQAGGWLVRKSLSSFKSKDEDAIEVQAEDRYRICEQCQTEILTSDNFCYNCGVQYHAGVIEQRRSTAAARRQRTSLFKSLLLNGATTALLVLYGMAGARMTAGFIPLPAGLVEYAAGAGVGLLSVSGVLFLRGFGHKLVSLALGGILGAAVYFRYF